MKGLSIYLKSGYSAITVENGVSRQTSGNDMSQVLDGMPESDRIVLLTFCNAVTTYCNATSEDTRKNAITKLLI